jgi:hypothetical protein
MTGIAICEPRALLSTVPSVEDVKTTKVKDESGPAEITHSDGIRSCIVTVFGRAELLKLTQQRATASLGGTVRPVYSSLQQTSATIRASLVGRDWRQNFGMLACVAPLLDSSI